MKRVSPEDVGSYICKAVSDIGLAVTKAKLYLQDVPTKKELTIKTAEEQEEKVKKERVKIEKKQVKKTKRGTEVTTDVEQTLEIKEITPLKLQKQLKM